MTDFATIGSVSHGTMRIEDLLPAFLDTLQRLDQDQAKAYHKELIELGFDHQNGYAILSDDDHISWRISNTALYEIVEEITDCLNDHAPPYCYFGANEGDGADYGFWPDIDAVEDDIRNDELQRINDPADLDYCNTSCGAVHVNDHGNMTLYIHNGDEWEIAWDIV